MRTMKLCATMACVAMAAVCFTSCDNSTKNQQESAQEDTQAAEAEEEEDDQEKELTFKTIVRDSKGQRNDVTISMQYPVDGPEVLVKAIREYINESFGGNYSGDQTDLANGEGMLKFYYSQRMADLNEYSAEDPEMGRSMQLDSVYVKCQTDEFITLMKYSEFFYAGAAHPGSSRTGVTFSKSDGQRMDWSMFKGQTDEAFQQLIKSGLMQYFDVETEEELRDELQLSSEYGSVIPVPNACPPIFTRRGVQFIYEEYEIASYAAGTPHFTIPYSELKPFMSAAAQKLIPKRKK